MEAWSLDIETYYKDHWVEINQERLARYEKMFVWHGGLTPMLAPAQIEEGHTVVDFGSGPGHLALELAARVTDAGHVHGVDVNAEFVAAARTKAHDAGVEGWTSFHHSTDETIPLTDDTAHRIICKNVLEYVPDADATLSEAYRVTKSGGRIHAIDSDFGFIIVEPWSADTVREFFAAAGPAFQEPNIGRKLPAAFRRAGFVDVNISVIPYVDTRGAMIPMLHNMAGYIGEFETMPDQRVASLLTEAEEAVAAGEFMLILPQFLVTATKSAPA